MKTIERSKGRKYDLGIDEKNLTIKSWRVSFLSTHFIKFDSIDEKKFLKIADIGDILLFRGKHIGAKITRSFTSSKFGKKNVMI